MRRRDNERTDRDRTDLLVTNGNTDHDEFDIWSMKQKLVQNELDLTHSYLCHRWDLYERRYAIEEVKNNDEILNEIWSVQEGKKQLKQQELIDIRINM